MQLVARAAEGVRALVEKYFAAAIPSPPPPPRLGLKAESVVRKTRWPLVASAVRTTNRHQIAYDTTEKDKNVCNKWGPMP
jgi:hypothetical protein